MGTHVESHLVCKSRTWAAALYLEHYHDSADIQYPYANEKVVKKLKHCFLNTVGNKTPGSTNVNYLP